MKVNALYLRLFPAVLSRVPAPVVPAVMPNPPKAESTTFFDV